MPSRHRSSGSLLLALWGAFAVASGCSSSTHKRAIDVVADAGAGGAPESGGAPARGESGAATEGGVSEGGMAGSGGVAGAVSEGGTSGSAGADALACVPEGGAFVLATSAIKTCRGATQGISYNPSSDPFTCCATFTTPPRTVELMPAASGDAYLLLLPVPEDAPLGLQTVAVSCGTNPVVLDIVDELPPVVTSVTDVVDGVNTITITGQNLTNVGIYAEGSDGFHSCSPDSQLSNANEIVCSLSNPQPGVTLILYVYRDFCGYATNMPILTVLPAHGT